MRCIICDVSDQGLSDYRPDGKTHAHKFTLYEGDYYCEECNTSSEETLNEMYENELTEEAFEYES